MYQVNVNVNQYAVRQAISRTASGSHIPLVASSLVLEVDAKSIGTKRMILIGRAKARNIGTSK